MDFEGDIAMDNVRPVQKVLRSEPTMEGAGVHLKRAFGFHQAPQLDPFLLLDDFHADDPRHYIKGFPWHPHRGIETITYVLHGKVEHGDSMGNAGIIDSGDVQWMTAGSGIIHQEMPRGQQDGLMWGFQLWANLPAAQKMMPPRYQEVKSEQIPEVTLDSGAKVKVICGEVAGIKGPVRDIVIDPEYLDITVPPDTVFQHPVDGDHRVFAYIIEGEGNFDARGEDSLGAEHLVVFGEGEGIAVSTASRPVRFLLISGRPIGEPVAWRGPIVMNTTEELRVAFEEYQNGTFIKHAD